MSRIYISGPMSNLPEWNFPAFNAAAKGLRELGFDVVNPAEVNPDTTMTWEQCLRMDIKQLCDCDSLVLLKGWQNSKGAQLELHVAHRLGLAIAHIEDMLP
jgi:hypothetical protein